MDKIDIDTKIDSEIRRLFESERKLSVQSDAKFVSKTIKSIESTSSVSLFSQFLAPLLLWLFVLAAGFLLMPSLEILRFATYENLIANELGNQVQAYHILIIMAALYWAIDQRKNFI